MSCTLFLLRHAIAADPAPGQSDEDRALTPDGARKMRRIARGLKALGFRADVVLTSPLRRAEETAALLVAELDPAPSVEIYQPLGPGHDPSDVLAELRRYRSTQRLVLVGHQPDLGELASHLLTGAASRVPLPFKKGGVAAIDVSSLPPRSTGTLQWFATPRMLRAMASSRR
jgi:phosphohistidine phosphatase